MLFDDVLNFHQKAKKYHISDEEVEINLKYEITEDFPVLEFKHLIKDEILSEIMNKRWLEIKGTYESGSYLSSIVLLGSVLEGLLYYYVSSNFKTVKSVLHLKTGLVN